MIHDNSSADIAEGADTTDWCTFEDYEQRCDPEMSLEVKQANWTSLIREKALESFFEVEKFAVRNK